MLLVLIIAPFWISYLMRMLSWVNLLQPNGYVNRILMALGVLQEPRGWLDGDPLTVVLGLVYGYVPFLILPLFASLDRIDRSLLEAARDLGASPARAFAGASRCLSANRESSPARSSSCSRCSGTTTLPTCFRVQLGRRCSATRSISS